MRSPLPKTKNGQSLLEAIVALAVAMLVILALVWVTTISIRNADFAKKQSQAAKYAQEGIENMRAQRDAGWSNFSSQVGLNPGDAATYGLADSVPSGNCLNSPNLGNIFIRCVKMERIESGDDGKIKVTLTVSWTDSAGTHKSEQISYFTKWQ